MGMAPATAVPGFCSLAKATRICPSLIRLAESRAGVCWPCPPFTASVNELCDTQLRSVEMHSLGAVGVVRIVAVTLVGPRVRSYESVLRLRRRLLSASVVTCREAADVYEVAGGCARCPRSEVCVGGRRVGWERGGARAYLALGGAQTCAARGLGNVDGGCAPCRLHQVGFSLAAAMLRLKMRAAAKLRGAAAKHQRWS